MGWEDIFGGVNAASEFTAGYLKGQKLRKERDEQMRIQRLMMEAMGQRRMQGKYTYGPEKGFGMEFGPIDPTKAAQAEYYRAMAELLKGYTGGMPVAPSGEPLTPTVPVEEPIDLFPEKDRWIYKTIKGIPTRVPAPPEKKKAPTAVEQFRADLRGAVESRDFTALRTKYPDKLDEIATYETQVTPVGREPIKPVGRFQFGLRAKPEFAYMSEVTRRVIGNIKTQADLNELMMNKADYETAGVNVNEILRYYRGK